MKDADTLALKDMGTRSLNRAIEKYNTRLFLLRLLTRTPSQFQLLASWYRFILYIILSWDCIRPCQSEMDGRSQKVEDVSETIALIGSQIDAHEPKAFQKR